MLTTEMKLPLRKIEDRVLQLSNIVEEVRVEETDNGLVASIYPDFEALKKRKIINIHDEVKWYAVETYNLNMVDGIRLDNFKIFQEPLSSIEEKTPCTGEAEGEVYEQIKTYLQSVTTAPVCPMSHLELDLGLDSLEYVMLFMFIEKSFGIHLDEPTFSKLMIMQDLCDWVDEHREHSTAASVDWHDVLKHKSRERLVLSPWMMMAWKALCWPYFKLFHKLKVLGVEKLPDAPFIIAPTHHSMLDGFAIIASLPSDILKESFFLAYEGEFGKPHLKPLAKHSQMLLIDINKDLKASLQRTALPLMESKNLVIFPENARSRDGKLLPFKKFFAILSKELGLPIVPVILHGTFEALPTGQSLPTRAPITVEYLDPVYPGEMSYDELSDHVKNMVEVPEG